jgi:hypothetical protein
MCRSPNPVFLVLLRMVQDVSLRFVTRIRFIPTDLLVFQTLIMKAVATL